MNRDSLKLYLVTDRLCARGRSLEEIVAEAVEAGVTMVQLREKEISAREFVELGRRLKDLLSPHGVPLIINDRVDVALAAGADGVHLGQSDLPYVAAREILGSGSIIGLSVENFAQIEEANALPGLDYIGISPVFATPTKTDTASPFGLDGLRRAAGMSLRPTVAIGGMNRTTAASVIGAGADGIAVVSAIMAAPSPRQAAAELLEIIDNERRIRTY